MFKWVHQCSSEPLDPKPQTQNPDAFQILHSQDEPEKRNAKLRHEILCFRIYGLTPDLENTKQCSINHAGIRLVVSWFILEPTHQVLVGEHDSVSF